MYCSWIGKICIFVTMINSQDKILQKTERMIYFHIMFMSASSILLPAHPLTSTTKPKPKKVSLGSWSRFFPSGTICEGASMWVPVCELKETRVVLQPFSSIVAPFLTVGGTSPGKTIMPSVIGQLRSITLIRYSPSPVILLNSSIFSSIRSAIR